MNRREFLQRSTALAGAAYLGSPALAETIATLGEPNLVIGIVSDIHLRGADTAATFIHTLEYFRSLKVDGVIIAGDMADTGMRYQLETVAEAWHSVFPGDKGADGRKVEKLFIYGNHDMEGCNNWGFARRHEHKASFEREVIANDPAKAWEDYFGEPYSPVWTKSVKGYRFVGAHWVPGHKEGIAAIEPFFGEHAADFAGDRPFFYIQHQHPKDTCHLGHAWGEDDGTATRVLSRFPNAVAVSGHSHTPLTDESGIWQGAFTSVGAASLRFCAGDFKCPTGANGYENIKGSLMPKYEGVWEARHGMVMSVFDDRIVFERRDFLRNAEPLGDDWVVPLPVASSQKPFAPANNLRASAAPEFAEGATLSVRDRGETIACAFPAATGVDGVRTFDWELTCEVDGVVRFTRHLVDYNCRNSIQRALRPVEVILAKSFFPVGASTLLVRPRGFNGRLGKALKTEIRT